MICHNFNLCSYNNCINFLSLQLVDTLSYIYTMIGVQLSTMFKFLLLFGAISLHKATSTIYYVIPDDDDYSSHHYDRGVNFFSLQHYLNNTSKYFVSHSQFHFMPGQYHINSDLIFKDINNFSVIGIDQCVIICTSPASIVIVNVSNVTLHNIGLINCVKHHNNVTYLLNSRGYASSSFSKITDYHTSVFLYNSSSVTICNMKIIATVMTNFTAILIVNTQDDSKVINIKVQINSFNCTTFSSHPVQISGLVAYYSGGIYKATSKLMITNFYYNNTYNSCGNHFYCVVVLLFLQNNTCIANKKNAYIHGFLKVLIQNSVFRNFKNSSVLCYYGETDRDTVTACRRKVIIENSTFFNNTGHPQLNMFHIVLDSSLSYFNHLFLNVFKEKGFHNIIKFSNCTFTRNINMEAIIYVRPPTTYETIGHITISESTFYRNKKTNFIKVNSESQISYVTTYLFIYAVNISCNEHDDGDSLIHITNGRILFHKSVFLNQNRYYENIISLQSSMILFGYYTEISGNYARHIVKAQSNSLLFVHVFTTVNISHNVVYKTTKQVSALEKQAVPICPLQSYDIEHKILDINDISYRLLLLHNTEMISKILPTDIISYVNKKCTWLEGSYYQKMNVNISTAYHKIVKSNHTFVNKENKKRLIPLSVCPCLSNGSYNCYEAHVYSVFPGQLLHMNLIVSPRWSDVFSTIVAANTIDDDCSIVDGQQLSQTHFNNGCNIYSYTFWPNKESIKECKLFIGLSEMPEMFYVEIKPCPMGFTLISSIKACYCDPLLNNDKVSITSCNINDATILRPANSWIFAETANISHSYDVSPQCPYDYCLPHPSHLNLSDPDSQCQFKRSGVLCGECKQGLSTVLGSSRCKHCSNFYVFTIIPIAIAGIMLVIMLFTFNLTVTNGIINTLIFYVNIISINYSQFCFDSNSPDCTILSLFNLDLGIETCFYNGMDGYTKMWLQLAFPSYLMIIAFTLIIGSRHSTKLQKLTANRVLKVLATLFLLSYTKILLTTCQVLFFFSTVTHVPSNHTTLVWSVDTGVVLFGVKFCILYSVCLILFVILLIFNAVLLFPRTVSRWSFINYFKPLLDVYFGPYKPKYPYWTGLQLFIRSSLFGLSVLTRNISLSYGAILVIIVLCTHGILQPFKSRYKNFQESLVLLNLSVVYYIALYCDNVNRFHKLHIIRILIITVLAYFILYIFCHCVMLLYGDVIKRRASKIKQVLIKMITVKSKQTCSKPLHMEELRSKIPDVAFDYKEFQESLFELD